MAAIDMVALYFAHFEHWSSVADVAEQIPGVRRCTIDSAIRYLLDLGMLDRRPRRNYRPGRPEIEYRACGVQRLKVEMVVCPYCGDKRCLRAHNHAAPCAKVDLYAHNAWVERMALRTVPASGDYMPQIDSVIALGAWGQG